MFKESARRALCAGQYILAGVGWPVTPVLASMMALLLLGTAACIVLLGAKLASAWQNLVMVLLLSILLVCACATAPQWREGRYTLAVEQLPFMWHGMALAFFSYTGWEMFASIAEDMQNPHRDFPRAVCISFVVIAVLYLSVALAIESTVAREDPTLATVPFLPVIANLTRNQELATRALGSVVGVIIFTNLVGAVWAASRMVFDLGRGSAFGERLKLDRVHPASASPRHSVLFILCIFATVLAAHATGMLSISTMLHLAGQNFFLLYAICVAVFYKTVKTRREKGLAILTLALLCAFGTVFSAGLVYPLMLFLVPYASRYCQSRRVQSNEATSQNNREGAPRYCGNPERQDRWALPRL